MPNMLDSFRLMADDTLQERPWSDMDSLLMASVCYNRFGDPVRSAEGMTFCELAKVVDLSPWAYLPYSQEREQLFRVMAESRRFGQAVISHYVDIVDHDLPMQFAAMTVSVPEGPVMICYRGTDNTITGWRQDLYMSFETPVPGQVAALAYLREIARQLPGDILLCGHSKGGNLAFYSAVSAEELDGRIRGAWSFDGPGLDDAMVASEAYAHIEPRLHTVLPQGSIIGVLKTQQVNHRLVLSVARGIRQHDVFSWQTQGTDFVAAEKSSMSSRFTDRTLDAFLQECTPEQRRACVDVLFDLLDATEAQTVTQLKANKKDSLARIAQAASKLDGKTYQKFLPIAGTLLQCSAGGVAGLVGDSAPVTWLKNMTEQLSETPAAEKVRDLQTQAAPVVRQLLQDTQETAAPILRQLSKGAGDLKDMLKSRLKDIAPKDGKEPHDGNE